MEYEKRHYGRQKGDVVNEAAKKQKPLGRR